MEEQQTVTFRYLSFVRRQRRQSLIDLSLAFRDSLESRVTETTYNSNDVQEILEELEGNVTRIMSTELQLHSHMNILLLEQLSQQATAQGLSLNPQFSSLEDKDLLERVKRFETETFDEKKATHNMTEEKVIIAESKENETLLAKENANLKLELSRLETRIKEERKGLMEKYEKTIKTLEEELIIAKMADSTRDPLDMYKENHNNSESDKLSLLQTQLADKDSIIAELESDLASRLEHSKAVQSLKGILSRKNELFRKLKAKHAA